MEEIVNGFIDRRLAFTFSKGSSRDAEEGQSQARPPEALG